MEPFVPRGFPRSPISATIGPMLALTRRRDTEANQERWLIHYGDVRVGSIGIREGNPTHTDQWQWRCGFYPGSAPGDCTSGTARTFEDARVAFTDAWITFLPKRTEADFEEWRRHQAWTAEKYRRFDRGERMRADAARLETRVRVRIVGLLVQEFHAESAVREFHRYLDESDQPGSSTLVQAFERDQTPHELHERAALRSAPSDRSP